MSYRDRLREAAYISPSLEVSFFLTNTLERSSGKKTETQEIIDSNESITQDNGNTAYRFPINAYFTGEDYDNDIDAFIALLEERHTLQRPGILQHPRWGDINVFPVSWSQKEELINGAQIGRVDVSFVQVFPQAYPISDQASIDNAFSNIDGMESLSEEMSGGLISDISAAAANIASKISGAVGIVSDAIAGITEGIEAVEDTITDIQNEIDDLIEDVAGNTFLLISAAQRLIRLPARLQDSTLNKINTYRDMVSDLCNNFLDGNETDPTNLRNNAILLDLFAGFAVVGLSESAVFTDFSIRTQSISAIENIQEGLDTYTDTMAIARTNGELTREYSGDHNYMSLLFDTVARIKAYTLNNAFDLKSEQRYILKTNSDAITECKNKYGTILDGNLEFFIETNNLINNEFLELSAGREVVVYV